MTLGDIERALTAYVNGLEEAKAARAVTVNLRALAALCREFAGSSVAQLVELAPACLEKAKKRVPRQGSKTRLADVLPHLGGLKNVLLSEPGGRMAVEIGLLMKSLQDDSVYLAAMLDALRELLGRDADPSVADFIRRLNADMGSDEFEHTLRALTSSDLKREQVVRIALAVYGAIPKSTSRKAALAYMRKPHDARVSARKGIDAQGGRSAA